MLKKYRLGFDISGFVLFLIIMIPNLIWFAVPAPNDVLRTNSTTEIIDTVASVCQVLMIAALCMIINRESEKMRISPYVIISAGCCLLYFVSWMVYYAGVVNAAVILGLTVLPCLAFLFFALDRKNRIAVLPILLFTICHLLYGVVNFIV